MSLLWITLYLNIVPLHRLIDRDQEDRDGKLSSLWRTGLDPWDWTQDTVGPFRFLLPVFVFTALFRIGIGSLAVGPMAIAWSDGSGKGFLFLQRLLFVLLPPLLPLLAFLLPAPDEVVEEVGEHRDGAGL